MKVPHLRIVVFFSVVALAAYGGLSLWVIFSSGDIALTGDTVGTWKSFAVAVVSFWIGSSSAGKARDDAPTGKPEDPVSVTEAPAEGKS